MGHLLGKRSVFCKQGVNVRPEGGIRARATLLVTLNDGLRISCFLLENRRFEQGLALGCHSSICVCMKSLTLL